MSTRPPLERWSPRALIGFPAFCDQKSLRSVLFTEGFSSFASPCQVANSQSRHEVLKVVALGELIFAGDQVSGHGAGPDAEITEMLLRGHECYLAGAKRLEWSEHRARSTGQCSVVVLYVVTHTPLHTTHYWLSANLCRLGDKVQLLR